MENHYALPRSKDPDTGLYPELVIFISHHYILCPYPCQCCPTFYV